MFTGDVYFAVLPGMGETNQESVRLYVLPRDDKKFGHGRRYHLSQRRQETSQVDQMAHIRNAVLGKLQVDGDQVMDNWTPTCRNWANEST